MDCPIVVSLVEPPRQAEAALIVRARHDPQAFAELYRAHYRIIAGYLFRRTGDRHLTEDLTGDVFLTALRRLPHFQPRGVPLRYWLYRIATNAANRAVRRARARAASPLERKHLPAPPDDPAGTAELRAAAQRALLRLPTHYQAVLSLHYLEGLPLDEIAAILGCRLGTVKSRLFRGRQALERTLARDGFARREDSQ